MKKLSFTFIALLFIGVTVQSAFAQNTKERNTKLLVNITKFLEDKPFDAKAENSRKNAFAFVSQTKDVSVTICSGDLTKQITKKKNKYGGELLIQYAIAMASFKLQNPDKKDDEDAAQLFGIESMLRSYESMISVKEKARYKGMDELIAKRDNDELPKIIKKAKCDKK